MSIRIRCYSVLMGCGIAIALIGPVSGQDVKPAQPAQGEVDQVIAKLGDGDDTIRERASLALEDLPDADLPLVQAAAKRDDLSLEVKTRLRRALPRMEIRARLHAKTLADEVVRQAYRGKHFRDAYDHDAHTNSKWDDAARQAIAADASRGVAPSPAERGVLAGQEQKLLQTAIDAGCDDPTVLTIQGLLASDTRQPPAAVFGWFERAAKASAEGKFDPFTRIIDDSRLLRGRSAGFEGGITQKSVAECGQLMSDMEIQYERTVKSPDVPLVVIKDMAQNVMNTATTCHFHLEGIFKRIDPALEAAGANDPGVLNIKGRYYIDWAWEARGGGWANSVTPQGWKDFADRLQMASDLLTKSWELDPASPDAATNMLTVNLGQGKGRDVEALWLSRVMAADPDNRAACDACMYYLEPKWYGDPQSMLAFGHQCFDGGNWHGELPFLLVDAHKKLSVYQPDRNLYYRNEGVWADINSVYSTYLQLMPENDFVRSQYAYYAGLCGQWKTANEQFTQLGDKLALNAMNDAATMRELRKRAAELGAK